MQASTDFNYIEGTDWEIICFLWQRSLFPLHKNPQEYAVSLAERLGCEPIEYRKMVEKLLETGVLARSGSGYVVLD